MAPTVKTKKLTLEQERKLLLKPCKTRDELKAWIKYFLSLELPDVTVSRYSDTNPFEVIWEVYNICVNNVNPENIQELLFVAGRGSGKCSVKGTKILTSSGLKNIEDVYVGDTVYTGWNWDKVKDTFDEGVKDSVRIKTKLLSKETPFTQIGSLKHRIQAVKEDGSVDWVYMPDLNIGQYVYKSAHCDFNINTSSKTYIDGWLIGLILGDGSVNRHQSNNITMCGSDFEMLRFYSEEVHSRFNIKQKIKRNSKKSVNLSVSSFDFKQWFTSYVEGDLCYEKKLKTLDHSPDFLAGVVSGLMETDGYAGGITLANKDLIYQIAQIFNMFGIAVGIDNERRPSAVSKFKNELVTYHECIFKTKLHDYLMPMFSKRANFMEHKLSMNEQYRYPNKLLAPFAKIIKKDLCADNGWLTVNGRRIRKSVPYAKELYGQLNKSNEYIYRYKIEAIRDFFKSIEMFKEVEKLDFILNGYYETISSIEVSQDYFYDLEIATTHSYWSNGFISHNTLGMAIAELAILLHDHREVVHVGAIQNQAERCYAYQKNFLYNRKLKPLVMPSDIPEDRRIAEKLNMSKSTFNLGGQKVTLEVLPCTLKAMNGPHVPLVIVDEIDTVSGEGVKAFKEISGMLDSRGDKKALRVGISTRKTRYGLMNRQIEEAEAADRTVRRWTALEFSEQCPDSRSGTKKMPLWVNQEKMEVLTKEEFDKRDKQKQKEYVEYEGYEGCAKCPIFSVCLGDAKKQTSTSPMLKPLDEMIKKVRTEGADWALAQLMNLKPSVEGIIFREFEERLHVKEWNQMWHILTGKEFPGICTHDIFVKKCHEMNLPCYAGVDWGFSAPNTVVYFFVDKRENIYVVKCDGMTYISQPTWIHHLKTKYQNIYRCQLYVPDTADQGAIQEMKKAGLPVANVKDKGQINTGIQVIKKWLKVPGSIESKIFFAKETCIHIVQEMGMYHYKLDAAGLVTDDPDTEYDHWIDALRYPMTLLFGKSQLVLGGGLDYDNTSSLVDNQGNYSRMPTPTEYAASNGMPINDIEQDMSKLGKIGTKRDLESDESQSISGGGGSFIWSF